MHFDRRVAGRIGLFVGLVGVEIWLASSMSSSATIRGYVDTRSYGVSSMTKGLVRKLDVSLGQSVTAGQVIAELDPGSLDDEIATQMAERKKLLASQRGGRGSAGSGAGSGSGSGEDTSVEALRVIDLRIEQLATQRDGMRLKSPVDGVIESLDVRPGDAVGPNSPVATVVTRDARRVIACIPESRLREVAVGRAAEVHAVVGDRMITGAVESLTPAVSPLPTRCQPPFAKIPEVGRVAVVLLDTATDLLPGQTELVSFGTEQRALPQVITDESRRTPSPIDVPAALAASTRVEASGLVWVQALDRYIVVSDETGLEKAAHPPWLFAMSRRGVVDPEPITVENVSQLDDIESVTVGDGNTLWIAASNSVSEKGNRPKAREQLIRLEGVNGGFRAAGNVRLAELLDAAPATTRTALGLTDTRALDIEAIAWRAGALYLGLKAPLDNGRAIIWRVAAPDRLLAGDLAGAGIAIWGTVAVGVELDGRPVPGGFSDLAFVSDTTLLATVTASAAGEKPTGALYTLARTGTDLRATFIEAFPGLRPEGVALSPDAGRIMIVFDRGSEPPLFLERDLPAIP